jgi:hypothetical protein
MEANFVTKIFFENHAKNEKNTWEEEKKGGKEINRKNG